MQLPEQFINYLKFEKRFSAHTFEAYERDVLELLEILEIKSDDEIKNINPRDLRRYLVALVDSGLENTSVNRKLSCARSFFRFLRQKEVIVNNPCIKLKSLKQKKVLPQFVPESQLWTEELFVQEKNEFDNTMVKLIFEVFYQTGIRLSELINLKESNISSNQIKVLGKRNKERIIPINHNLSTLISEFRNLKERELLDREFLFVSQKNKKLSPKFVYRKVNYYLGVATDLGKKSPHVLRHTFATHMLNNGASLESIKKLLGHVDLSATQIYTHNSFAQIKSIYNRAHPRGAA